MYQTGLNETIISDIISFVYSFIPLWIYLFINFFYWYRQIRSKQMTKIKIVVFIILICLAPVVAFCGYFFMGFMYIAFTW